MKSTVDILGTKYSVALKRYEDDAMFKRNKWVGYCDENSKEIGVCNLLSHPDWKEDLSKESADISQKQILRHEVVHAFFNESGLTGNTLSVHTGWANNEEMVDWFANQGVKIYAAWEKVGAL